MHSKGHPSKESVSAAKGQNTQISEIQDSAVPTDSSKIQKVHLVVHLSCVALSQTDLHKKICEKIAHIDSIILERLKISVKRQAQIREVFLDSDRLVSSSALWSQNLLLLRITTVGNLFAIIPSSNSRITELCLHRLPQNNATGIGSWRSILRTYNIPRSTPEVL